jgi:DNA-directed RNA polymerase specialized sigma24 family protein
MPLGVSCGCTLCSIETRLLSDLASTEAQAFGGLFCEFDALRHHSSVRSLLSDLKTSPADLRSDTLLAELLAARSLAGAFVEGLLVLAFLPMLHGTVRRVARQQPGLEQEDIAQQALSFLLRYLGSGDLRTRESHFAFVISRAVKRELFEWANRESGKAGLPNHDDGKTLATLPVEDPFERYVVLRHFLNRCVTEGQLTEEEINLLVDFKLNGTSGMEFADFNGSSLNAVRQRLKRLVAKLRRLAR